MHVSGGWARSLQGPASLRAHFILCGVMKTFRLDPTAGDQTTALVKAVDELLREGKRVVVTIAEAQERSRLPIGIGMKRESSRSARRA